MVATLYWVCLDHAEGSTEGVTFVNPDDTGLYMKMGHNRLTVWAKAILGGDAGVDKTHPPRTSEFEWLPVPGATSQASQPEPTSNANQSTPNANESDPTRLSSASRNNMVASISNQGPPEDGVPYGPVAAAYTHFNSNSTHRLRSQREHATFPPKCDDSD
jgi:hypothetical protein